MTPSDEPKVEPLPVSALDIHYAERRENGEVIQLTAQDRCAIRQAREDEWEAPVIAPYIYKPLTHEQIERAVMRLAGK
jgi:hypothetical protein